MITANAAAIPRYPMPVARPTAIARKMLTISCADPAAEQKAADAKKELDALKGAKPLQYHMDLLKG